MNNREIRFRAWDKADKIMYYDIQRGIKFEDDSEYPFDDFLNPKEGDYHKWKTMQLTTLFDKNGKEIWEGDIVEVWLPGMPHDLRATQEIMFVDGVFGCGTYPLNLVDKYAIEIIGNIYENSELLNNLKK